MRGVTQVMSVIMIISISIALVALLWFFVSGTYNLLTTSGESTVGEALTTVSSCMKIESVSGNKIYIRNCGEGVITEDTLKIYLDDVPIEINTFECSSASEYSTITVKCPQNLVINSIEDSIYTHPSSPASCSNLDTGGYCYKYCDYADNCIGNNFCSFYVNNTNCGGDPCPGVDKKLFLKVRCGSNKPVIKKDEVGTFFLQDLWNLPSGGHLLRVTNPKVITEMPVEAVLPDSCVLALDFDEGEGNITYDESGYGNDGTLGNGTVGTRPIWKFGSDCKYGNCLEFEGTPYETADVVNVTDIPNGSLTVMAWIYPKQILGDQRVIVSKWHHEGSGSEWIFRLSNNTASQLQFYIINMTNGWEEADSTDANIQKDNWYHVAVTYNRETGQVDFYKNGIHLTTNRLIGQARDGSQIVRIGAQAGGSFDPFNGTIDSVRIYNKALTPDETIILRPVKYD